MRRLTGAALVSAGAALLGAAPGVHAEPAAPAYEWVRGGPVSPVPPPPPPPPRPAPPPPVPQVAVPVRPAPPAPPAVPVALALTGAAALAALAAAGGVLGYRQAKAGFALRSAGTARFLP